MQLTRLGPYEIGRPIGKGGMGSVYEAIDGQTGQRVAIKALSPHLAMAEGFRERFEAEIESLKTLRHDGIVRLYGYGEQDGILFYSMELVEGISLEDELKAGRRFNWRDATNIAIQLSSALKHAHDHGIVHRDIKPANVLLYDEDHVKLADFGIARLFGTTQLTTAGGVLGTADYMSPEQAEGRPVTARCDQYSLGGVMYALLAGRPPFLAKNLPQMLQLQRFANPEPVRRYAPDTPEQLERVILQLLAKEPADRFPNMQVLARHLQALALALSRPASDDFALAVDPSSANHRNSMAENLLAVEITQAEPESLGTDSPAEAVDVNRHRQVTSTQEAATLAAEESVPSRATSSQGPAGAVAAKEGIAKRPFERPTRFTTLEEEESRLQAQRQRSWLVVGGQLTALGAVLAGMAAVALYMSRPPSADDLYESISMRIENDEDFFGGVESEVDEFLERYPSDARGAELTRYKERIELDRLERKLQREARGGGHSDSSLRPVEQLYVQAIGKAESSPDMAAAMLASLVNLYGPAASEQDETSAIVQLANRRLETLKRDLSKEREQLLKSLSERLQAAKKLVLSEPQQAAAMYRAIINLYRDQDWAQDVVTEARTQLTELEKRSQ